MRTRGGKLLLWLAVSAPAAAHGACEPLTPAGLEAMAVKKGGALQLVFFASWCSSCREHLTAKYGDDTLLIGAFDKRERLEETLTALKVTTPCYADAGIAEALNVSKLPTVLRYDSAARK